MSLFGGERARGENQFFRTPFADGARKVLGSAAARHDSKAHLRKRKARAASRVDEIAAECRFHPAAVGSAVHRGDYR